MRPLYSYTIYSKYLSSLLDYNASRIFGAHAKRIQSFWSEDRLLKAKDIGLSPHEVSVLASIVQKETAKTDEQPIVAGLYMNRIKQGMKLQSDPTVIYAMKRKRRF